MAKGFQENEKPQIDSPPVSCESLKTFIAIASNDQFKICTVDITVVFFFKLIIWIGKCRLRRIEDHFFSLFNLAHPEKYEDYVE